MSDMIRFTTGDRLRRARKQAGLSVHGMAEELQLERNTIGRWENDSAVPPLRRFQQWSAITGVPLNELLEDLPDLARTTGCLYVPGEWHLALEWAS